MQPAVHQFVGCAGFRGGTSSNHISQNLSSVCLSFLKQSINSLIFWLPWNYHFSKNIGDLYTYSFLFSFMIICLKACFFSLRCWYFQLTTGVMHDHVEVVFDEHSGFHLKNLQSSYSATYQCKAVNSVHSVILRIACKTITNIYLKFAAVCLVMSPWIL